ncbi:MAG: O-antigen ligase family protein [Crocinitomicaceae bacterium]|nr:O-antigen ligase family protein [Crocinitomicaceae bacterium]MDG1776308.1 O-antigen ligase family protein [Crocinitomicaceae bacterium]
MHTLKKNSALLGLSLLYIVISCCLIWTDQVYLTLAPLGLMAVYFALFYTEYTFLSLAFLTPLSINIEEYTESFGLFIPTEPILFGLMLLLLMQQMQKNTLANYIWKNPIIWAVGFYLFWITITAITSSSPVTSFKFLLARLWFIVPLLVFGTRIFINPKNIRLFIWLFCIAMCIAITYTITVHSGYNFGEKEGHWVMWPFFKDHTIYGSTVAFSIPLIIALYFSKKHTLLMQITLIGLITIMVTGLYFSYTRAAWLSVILSLGVLAVIKLRIKFSILATVAGLSLITLYFSWDAIQMELERNKYEHTTEEFGEKLQSATNVTTDASNLERLNRWSSAIEMFKERPVFGFGPGTYAFEYARFQEPENTTIISTNFGDAGNAHSEYLGPLSEMGLIGLLAILFIISAIFYKGITLYYAWPAHDREMRTLILAMILSLATYFIHGILNNYLDTDKAAVPIWAFCAAFIALEQYNKTQLESEDKR